MSLKYTNDKIKKIKADEETKDAFLELIDHKIENDMEKAVTRLEAAIDKLNTKLESSIGSLKESNSNIKWILTGIGAIALLILGKLFKGF